MKIAILYYDGFAEFEIVLAAFLFHRDHEIISLGLEKREYRSEEKQRYIIDQTIEEADADAIDLLIIPGGNFFPLLESPELKKFIGELLSKNKKVAGICAGAGVLAAFGFLKGKKCTGMSSGVRDSERPNVKREYEFFEGAITLDDYVVVDGNIITAQGQAFTEFAVELARQMGLYDKNPQEYDGDLKWLKNIRD
jgi:putative intracellular protease/amidase